MPKPDKLDTLAAVDEAIEKARQAMQAATAARVALYRARIPFVCTWESGDIIECTTTRKTKSTRGKAHENATVRRTVVAVHPGRGHVRVLTRGLRGPVKVLEEGELSAWTKVDPEP